MSNSFQGILMPCTLQFLILFLLAISTCIYFNRTYHQRALSSIPGSLPFALSNIPRLLAARTYSFQVYHLSLHRKYGPVVRLGPNTVSLSNPAFIPTIYNFLPPEKGGYVKSSFYRVTQNVSRGKTLEGMFNTMDEALHTRMRGPVERAYSMSVLKHFEEFVDDTTALLLLKLERFNEKEVVDLGMWLHWWAFDVIGQLTFSKRLGFLEQERDVDGIMKAIDRRFEYASVVGQMPWLDFLLAKNSIVNYLWPESSYVVKFAVDRIQERTGSYGKHQNAGEKQQRDFLSRFLDAQFITSWSTTNVTAGSDTTAISIRAVLYFLLRNTNSLSTLLDEIASSQLSDPVSWDEARKLPYLGACVKEAMRLHPAVGLPLERIVPTQGLHLGNGVHLEAGTVVGISAWVVGKDIETYGEDAEDWRPERWLDTDEESLKKMERASLAFGAGVRGCIGKNISLLAMYKLIPQLLRKFKIELANPEKGWKLTNAFFVRQDGIKVRMKPRQKG